MKTPTPLPKLGFLYLNHVMRFFNHSNFKGWPDRIEEVTYRWGNDKQRFINEVKRKKIDVLIGNIPATAYESFREIARALPAVRFIPSLDAQFANKSKENVTHFCHKYQLPTPDTKIFYVPDQAEQFLKHTGYPKIIKRSYGPSNYGGYYVHKVDSYSEAKALLSGKKYFPVYVQDFIPMEADIRVMLIGHKPVCAFWRRPPEGKWLTNTSQGGAADYSNVPQSALDLAARCSRAANAEYWACDIALGKDGKLYILECATAFAAFSYIRDWIGQYLIWKLSGGRVPMPWIPLYNWEELGKINSNVLRTIRHISFSHQQQASRDGDELFSEVDDCNYPMMDTRHHGSEEWPSEEWNLQDNCRLLSATTTTTVPVVESPEERSPQQQLAELDEQSLMGFFAEVKGISKNLASNIIETFGTRGVTDALINNPARLCEIKNLKEAKLQRIKEQWNLFYRRLLDKAGKAG